ncbi:hypothetical protein SK128_013284 [Halocaridina rubra]|uniref:Uncharacterized protein n=1 Tax=Halocaridina rubra TaxID=373956 RepID=A0AAN8WGC0_HALRR
MAPLSTLHNDDSSTSDNTQESAEFAKLLAAVASLMPKCSSITARFEAIEAIIDGLVRKQTNTDIKLMTGDMLLASIIAADKSW